MTLEKIDTLPENEAKYWKQAIKVDPKKGLTPDLILASKNLYGENKLTVRNAKSLFIQILEHFKGATVILLTIAAIISLVLGIIEVSKDTANYAEWGSLFLEFLIIVGIIFVDVFLSIRQSNKTGKALQTLKNLSVPVAKVIRDGKIALINSSNVVPGDILVLEAGESVPADGELIEATSLQVDESVLTGESVEVEKDSKFISNDSMPVGDKKNWVFSGTNIANGSGKCRVIYTGMKTQIGTIAGLLESEVPELTPLQKQIAKLSKFISIIAISVCLVTFVLYMIAMTGYQGINGSSWLDSLNVSISLAIASIPETLLAVVSIVLSIAVQRMSKQNALIKQLPAIETLGSVSVVCTDKTGTLTKNSMTVTKAWYVDYPLQIFDISKPKSYDNNIFKYGTLCSDAKMYKEKSQIKYIGDSTETAILKAFVKNGGDVDKIHDTFPRLHEIPFDSDRKMMTVIVKSDKPGFKYMIITKGAPDYIFERLDKNQKNVLTNAIKYNNEMGKDALRVLALSVKYVNELPKEVTPKTVENSLNIVGLFGIIDPPREEAIVSIEELREAGIKTVMITGDHKTTAFAIAKELKLMNNDDMVISGDELDKMSDEELAANIEKYSVYARVSPAHKLRIVNAWKANGKIVSMTGDGVNDAPSLKAANIGCAMGITGTDVAKDASEMILMDDNFSTIVRAIESGRKVMLNIKAALTMLLTANLANLLCVLLGILAFEISPLKSLQLLVINVVVETTLSFAIATNVRNEDVMQLKPRNPKQFIVDSRMLLEIFVFGAIIGFVSLIMFWVGFTTNSDYDFSYKRMIHDIWQYNNHGANGTYYAGNGSYNVFLTYYGYGSLLSFLSCSLCLSINGLYARTKGSIFNQKFAECKKMLAMVCISISVVVVISFIPKLNNLFNMGIYDNWNSVKNNWFISLPFIVVVGYIFLVEMYRLLFNSFFNSDGSLKKKTKTALV